MTSDVVMDSCVVAKWILSEADSARARQVLVETTQSGGQAIVLDIAFAEVANAVWKRLHRGLLTRTEAELFLQDLETIPVRIEVSRVHLTEAFRIAAQFDRSVYDALFVAAAHHLGLRAVTSDAPLGNAVRSDFPEVVLLNDWLPPPQNGQTDPSPDV